MLVDWTPGARMMCKAGMTLGCKSILVANNLAHQKCLQAILHKTIRDGIVNDLPHLTPTNKHERLTDAKAARLLLAETQKGVKRANPAPAPEDPAKRAKVERDGQLQALADGVAPKAASPALAPQPKPTGPQQQRQQHRRHQQRRPQRRQRQW